eukprot:TRINITY_DN43601_c0_g1_i1.p1 TRINITY_DN43601_c0_g1~~TRINITY_DN43601_c0_g1_i1.p1  ORF type:complete len:431 (-),score=45.72 TRINITY_DN43601_c0_g1_i1:375-1667(-)
MDADTVGRPVGKDAEAGGQVEAFTVGLPQEPGSPAVPEQFRPASSMCRSVMSSWWFFSLSFVLTSYLLFAGDIRALCDKSADMMFDLLTVVCITLLMFEIGVTYLAIECYLRGLQFKLDVLLVLTALLDISFISDHLLREEGEGSVAHLLARFWRMVRLLRLVRFQGAFQTVPQLAPDDRRMTLLWYQAILLLTVSVSFAAAPLFHGESFHMTSNSLGVDMVHNSFIAWRSAIPSASAARLQVFRELYEHNLLFVLHYHNWHAEGGVSEEHAAPIFWLGLEGDDAQAAAEEAYINATSLQAWRETWTKEEDIFGMEALPSRYDSHLTSVWADDCTSGGVLRYGISISELPCPSDLRRFERQKYTSRTVSFDEYTALRFVFYADIRAARHTQAISNLVFTAVLILILSGATYLLGRPDLLGHRWCRFGCFV